MNSVILIGRLTRKPELRYSNSGDRTAIARFSLAVDRPYSKDKEEKEADFVNIVVFGKQAENCERYLDKGRQAAVQGRIQTGSYKDKDGNTRYTTEVVADRVEFLGSNNNTSNNQSSSAQVQNNDGIPEGFSAVSDEDIPF